MMEERGVPATAIVTEPFAPIVEGFGKTLGMPDYPTVPLPHPLSIRDDDELRKLAESIIDQVEHNLTALA